MTDDIKDSIRERAGADDERPLEVRRVLDRLNSIGPGVNNATTSQNTTAIDFSVVDDVGLSPIDRMTDGRFASSLTVVHGGPRRDPKIGTALIRFGSIGLNDSADEFLAEAELEEMVEGTDPPAPVNVRFRELASSFAGDILHVQVEDSADIGPFLDWLERVTTVVDREAPRIAEKANRLGEEMDI